MNIMEQLKTLYVYNEGIQQRVGTNNIVSEGRKQKELHNNIIYVEIYTHNIIYNL